MTIHRVKNQVLVKGCEIMNLNMIIEDFSKMLCVSEVEPDVVEKVNPENGEIDLIQVMQPSLGGSVFSLFPWYVF